MPDEKQQPETNPVAPAPAANTPEAQAAKVTEDTKKLVATVGGELENLEKKYNCTIRPIQQVTAYGTALQILIQAKPKEEKSPIVVPKK